MPSARVFPASAQQVADSRNEKYMLPIYGDLLTFPLQLDASEKIKVDWSEDRGHKRSAYYYRIRGWFKRLNRENEPGQSYWTGNWDKAWSVSGGSREVDVYVAEDYIHPAFQFGPPSEEKHLLNIPGASDAGDEKPGLKLNWTNDSESGGVVVTAGWAKLTCTEELFYGQSASKESRFIVYHPARDVFQGRFKKDKTQVFLESAAASIPTIKVPILGFTLIKMDKEKAASLGSLLLSVRGDSLRQFIYPDINNNVPPEWQRKVKKDDDDQSLIPVAVFSSKTDNSGPIVKPVDFPNMK